MKNNPRPLFLFYLLTAYILLQFCWWAYHINDLNKTIAVLETENILLSSDNNNMSISEETQIKNKLEKKFWMILGEASVFLIIMVWGIWKVRQSFRKEFELSQRQKNFLLSVTHELKTPLASVQLSLQTLQKRKLDKEKENEIISGAIAETERLSNLVGNILLAAKIDSDYFSVHFEKVNFSEQLASIITMAKQSFAKNHILVSEIENNLALKADAESLYSIAVNLIENAVKYSPENSKIIVQLFQSDNNIILTVSDSGKGIATHERTKIFEKFYRIENEETRKTKGTGLGLYIVKKLVEMHGASIKVNTTENGGTAIEVNFMNK
jgi:two-component system, OmpR family, phosphate regulon sensor histidine kinase PhoR